MNAFLRRPILALVLIMAVPVGANTFAPFYLVNGNSMLPAFYPGDIALTHHYSPKHINDWIGKVIVFLDQFSGRIIIHRVVAIDGQYLRTRGDNNTSADVFEPFEQDILGIVYGKISLNR